MTAEIRRLKLHPLAIHTFIKAQAGSLAKALTESVMNSIDASATKVVLTLDETGFVVEDDGHGFRNKAEVASWFETLGFPHDEGNHRIWGYHGMGRAQAWSYASTVWQSNTFEMHVDVKKTGLDYELHENLTPIMGTRIVGSFYAAMSLSELLRVEQELVQLVKFVPVPVLINGKLASEDASLREWAIETPEAWMDLEPPKSGSPLYVYNAGVLVNAFQAWQYRASGIIVTKPDKPLKLNLARNAILESECQVWKAVRKSIPVLEEKFKPAKKVEKASAIRRAEVVSMLRAGTLEITEALNEIPDLLVSVTGRSIQRYKLVSRYAQTPVVVCPKGDEVGKNLAKVHLAIVLAQEPFDDLGISLEEVRAWCERAELSEAESYPEEWLAEMKVRHAQRLWTASPKEHFKEFFEGVKLVPFSDLSPIQKAYATAWQRSWAGAMGRLDEASKGTALEGVIYERAGRLEFGENPSSSIWKTEGSALVLHVRDLGQGFNKVHASATKELLNKFHRCCVVIADDEEAGNQLFLRAVTQTTLVSELLHSLFSQFARYCSRNNIELTAKQLNTLEMATA